MKLTIGVDVKRSQIDAAVKYLLDGGKRLSIYHYGEHVTDICPDKVTQYLFEDLAYIELATAYNRGVDCGDEMRAMFLAELKRKIESECMETCHVELLEGE